MTSFCSNCGRKLIGTGEITLCYNCMNKKISPILREDPSNNISHDDARMIYLESLNLNTDDKNKKEHLLNDMNTYILNQETIGLNYESLKADIKRFIFLLEKEDPTGRDTMDIELLKESFEGL